MKRCFLMGHRDADSRLKAELSAEIERHITELGVTEFLVGNHGAFDRLAAAVLGETKQRHPDVMMTLLLAYLPAKGQVELPDGFDGSLYPPNMESTPRKYAIVRANQYALSVCRYMIAYAWQPGSNTLRMAETAQRKGVAVSYIGCDSQAWQDLELFSQEHCTGTDEDYDGKVLVLDPAILKDKYKSPDHQLFLATGGFGCSTTARGRAVYVTVFKEGQEMTFKTAAHSLRGYRNSYNCFDIQNADRQRFEQAFGRYADYTADEITRITYGRNAIYEAAPVMDEEVSHDMEQSM